MHPVYYIPYYSLISTAPALSLLCEGVNDIVITKINPLMLGLLSLEHIPLHSNAAIVSPRIPVVGFPDL